MRILTVKEIRKHNNKYENKPNVKEDINSLHQITENSFKVSHNFLKLSFS